MRSLGMETVLIGDIIDGVSDVGLRINVSVATANDEALVLLAGVLKLRGFLMGLAVRQLVRVLVSVDADVVQRSLLHEHDLAGVLTTLGRREGDGDDSGESDDLRNIRANNQKVI